MNQTLTMANLCEIAFVSIASALAIYLFIRFISKD